MSSASIVIEIVSPDDAGYAKVPFYLSRGVREVWLLDPTERTLTLHTDGANADRTGEAGAPDSPRRSTVLDVDLAEVTRQLGW